MFTDPKVLASAGAELALTAAILSWDVPYRFRAGLAFPFAGRDAAFGTTTSRAYLAFGTSF